MEDARLLATERCGCNDRPQIPPNWFCLVMGRVLLAFSFPVVIMFTTFMAGGFDNNINKKYLDISSGSSISVDIENACMS